MNQFALGLSSAAAALFSCPFDAFKTVLQTRSELFPKQRLNYLATIKQLLAQKGVLGLYVGLQYSMLRHFVFTEINVGIMNDFRQRDQNFSFESELRYALLASSAATALSNPMDVLLIRKQVGLLRIQKPESYNTFSQISRLNSQEGLRGLIRGTLANMIKISLIISTQLGYHHYAMQDGKRHLTFANLIIMVAAGSILAIPFDNLKIKMQKNPQMKKGYKECLRESVRNQGPLGLWVGLPIYFIRNVIQTFMSIMIGSVIRGFQKKNIQQ